MATSQFTKKHYIKLAEVLQRNNEDDILHDLIVDLSNLFYMDNDAFNTKKFLKACEPVYKFKKLEFTTTDLMNIKLGLQAKKPKTD